jgi:hypothetical protein
LALNTLSELSNVASFSLLLDGVTSLVSLSRLLLELLSYIPPVTGCSRVVVGVNHHKAVAVPSEAGDALYPIKTSAAQFVPDAPCVVYPNVSLISIG